MGSSAAGYVKARESYVNAAIRKLQAELGIKTPLISGGEFVMVDESSKKFVAVFTGRASAKPRFDSSEIASLEYLRFADIRNIMDENPNAFTQTFQNLYKAKRNLFVLDRLTIRSSARAASEGV